MGGGGRERARQEKQQHPGLRWRVACGRRGLPQAAIRQPRSAHGCPRPPAAAECDVSTHAPSPGRRPAQGRLHSHATQLATLRLQSAAVCSSSRPGAPAARRLPSSALLQAAAAPAASTTSAVSAKPARIARAQCCYVSVYQWSTLEPRNWGLPAVPQSVRLGCLLGSTGIVV